MARFYNIDQMEAMGKMSKFNAVFAFLLLTSGIGSLCGCPAGDDGAAGAGVSGPQGEPGTFCRSFGGVDGEESVSTVERDDGGYIASWNSFDFDSNRYILHLKTLDGSGTDLSDTQVLPPESLYYRSLADPALHRLENGELVVAGRSAIRSLDGTLENINAAGAVYDVLVAARLSSDLQTVTWDTVAIPEDIVPDSVIPLEDGLVYEGRTPPSGGVDDFTHFVSRLDSQGSVIWSTPFAEPGTDTRGGEIVRSGASFFVAGTEKYSGIPGVSQDKFQIHVTHIGSDGSILWRNTYLGSGDSLSYRCMVSTADGGAVIGAQPDFIRSPGWEDTQAHVLRLDSAGEVVWYRALGGAARPVALTECANGDIVLVNLIDVEDLGVSSRRLQIVRAGAEGNVLWIRTIGANGDEYAYSVLECADGGLLLSGESRSFTDTDEGDVYLVKLTESGVGTDIPSDF